MKKIYFEKRKVTLKVLLVALGFLSVNVNAQCLNADVILNTQEQVNTWAINFPNCTRVAYTLRIGAPNNSDPGDITDLSPLGMINEISGSLVVQNNALLESLQGLKVTKIGGRINIGGEIPEISNLKLKNLEGLNQVTSVGQFLMIRNNPALENLNALSNLTSIAEDIEVSGNTVLSDISGLKNTTFNPTWGLGLTIMNNPALAVCNLPNFCGYIANSEETHPRVISGNLANCLDEQAVTTACSSSPSCSYGVVSDGIANGENISTGGTYEYTSASDFDIEFGKILTVNNVKFNALKGTADLSYVNIYFYADNAGKPGDLIKSYENVVPTSQTFKYTVEDNSAYEINVDLPTTFDLPKGKYYLSVQGKPGDSTPASWEINNQETTKVGRFDFSKFDSEDWFGGFSYYDHVFQVSGICSSTGETQPDYGTPASQGNLANNHEIGGSMPGRSLADDIIVTENTKFTLTNFKISTLQLGNIKNATINIRASVDDTPGEILHSFENIGPKTENYFGYWPVPGYPLDVVAVDLDFELPQAVELTSGKYFIEVRATPVLFTDYLRWEATSHAGIGSDSYTSYDGGETWEVNEGYNFVFDAIGFSKSSLAVNDVDKNNFSFYPNPVKDELTIVSKDEASKISIYNMAGQLVKASEIKNNKVNVSDLIIGNYIGKITLKNGQKQTIKVIKK